MDPFSTAGREQIAEAVAGGQAETKHAARQRTEADKIASRPDLLAADCQPPRIIKAVVLFQAQVRVKKFLRRFGPNAFQEYPEFAPGDPQVVLALFLCRRLTKTGWVNLGKEALGVAAVLTEKQHLSLTVIGGRNSRIYCR